MTYLKIYVYLFVVIVVFVSSNLTIRNSTIRSPLLYFFHSVWLPPFLFLFFFLNHWHKMHCKILINRSSIWVWNLSTVLVYESPDIVVMRYKTYCFVIILRNVAQFDFQRRIFRPVDRVGTNPGSWGIWVATVFKSNSSLERH